MWKLHTGRLLWNLRWRRRLVAMELRGQPGLAVREIGRRCAAVVAALRPSCALVAATLVRPVRPLLRFVRGRRRLTLVVAGGAVVLASVLVVLVPVLSGRTTPPVYTRNTAQAAVEAARAEGAPEWAPRTLAEARALLDQGLDAYGRQERRVFFLRDFTVAKALLEMTAARGRAAESEARDRRGQMTLRAQTLLGRATEMVGISRAFASMIPLQPYERRQLARARLVLFEALDRFRDGDHKACVQLAGLADSLADDVSAACSVRALRFEDPSLLRRWRGMIDETIRWSRATGGVAIVVRKTEHSLTLYRGGVPRVTYRTDLGTNTVADKSFAGDYATPEGRYRIIAKRGSRETKYYKALLLDYPNPEDLARFARDRRAGLVRGGGPGRDIEIHGEGGRYNDWTKGCVAIANAQMDVLFDAVVIGTPVTIVGSEDSSHPYADLVERYRTTAEKRKS
jgi:L,D-transpeptidase-like protein